MMDIDTLTLTDDEAAAVALRAGRAWRTPLPTVDETSDADVAAAILRGRRSLVVRDLAQPDGTPIGAAAEVLTRLGTGPCAAFMLVDDSGTWVPAGLTVYLYGPGPGDVRMSHVVASAGVHYFRVDPPPGQWTALTYLIEAVFASGFNAAESEAQQPAAALLFVAREAGHRSVRVAQGKATVGQGAEPAAFRSAAEATAWLQA